MKPFTLVIIINIIGMSICRHILLVPLAALSHVRYFTRVGSPLVEQGHEVYAVLNGNCQDSVAEVEKAKIKLLTYSLHHGSCQTEGDKLKEDLHRIKDMIMNSPDPLSLFRFASDQSSRMAAEGDALFANNNLQKRIKELNFDLVIVDGSPLTVYQYVLPYKLDLPYITLSTAFHSSWARVPDLPSITPVLLSTFSNRMTFSERVRNTIIQAVFSYCTLPGSQASFITKYAPEKEEEVSLNCLQRRSKLWLINTDVAMDHPRPLLPHVIPVGKVKFGILLQRSF